MRKFLISSILVTILSALAIAQGQPNYAVTATIDPSSLAANSLVTQTLCFTNSGVNNSESIPVGAIQTFNIDTLVGVAGTAGAVRVTDPIPVQPTANPTTASDWIVTQGINTNKVFFNFVSPTAKDLPAGTKVCVDVPIATGNAVEARIRFFGSLTTSTGNVPFVNIFVK